MKARRKQPGNKRMLLKCGFFLYLAVCLFMLIWMRAAVVSLEYEIGDLDKTRAELIRERKLASAQRANIYSAEKIENVALKRLGMELPDRDYVFFVKKGLMATPYKTSLK